MSPLRNHAHASISFFSFPIMHPFRQLSGIVAPLNRANIDTDQIIPKQFLGSIRRSGFGPHLFDAWRYFGTGQPHQNPATRQENPDFVLNQKPYRNANILLTGENFGCGSSREHAAWALEDFGIRAIIAPSFADIFYNNCCKNGILPIIANGSQVKRLFTTITASFPLTLTVDLPSQRVYQHDAKIDFGFEINPFDKQRLLEGLDDIGLTLNQAQQIRAFEATHRSRFPWIFYPLHVS